MFVAIDVAVNDQVELPEASGFFELFELVQKKNHGKKEQCRKNEKKTTATT